jgi:virginiamycin B lyase
MFLSPCRHWLKRRFQGDVPRAQPVGRVFRPQLQALEDRCLLSGLVTEFLLPDAKSAPTALTAGPDGSVWFVEPGKHALGRLTPQGRLTEFYVNDSPTSITPGTDGNPWFTTTDGIGRITPAGDITRFVPVMHAPMTPTPGPDGSLWFTEQGSSRLGHITATGQVYEIALGDSIPLHLALGLDGSVWFTDARHDRIGRLTPAGGLTVFTLPQGSCAYDLTAGADGNLWFTEGPDRSAIGQMTPAGVVREYDLAPGHTAESIRPGPEGGVWIVESGGVGRIEPATGVVVEFALPASFSGSFAIAPDGSLWFALRTGLGELSGSEPALMPDIASHAPGTFSVSVYLDGGLYTAEATVALTVTVGVTAPLQAVVLVVVEGPKSPVALGLEQRPLDGTAHTGWSSRLDHPEHADLSPVALAGGAWPATPPESLSSVPHGRGAGPALALFLAYLSPTPPSPTAPAQPADPRLALSRSERSDFPAAMAARSPHTTANGLGSGTTESAGAPLAVPVPALPSVLTLGTSIQRQALTRLDSRRIEPGTPGEENQELDAFFAGLPSFPEAVVDQETESFLDQTALLAMAQRIVNSDSQTGRTPAKRESFLLRMAVVLLLSRVAYVGLGRVERPSRHDARG